ncbi:AbrB/MazE/SpoVT family DNA-binding domain-containing protein [Candidatus Woesearchaeota archaeon]|nr:AbrB/MazE/SpoVT family DNA-binding domain-containing protein [Candidatus Woesearchaeota archaeon]
MIVTVSKGQQITIPSKYRKDFGLRVGSKVEIIKRGNDMLVKPIEEDLSKLFKEAQKIRPKYKLTAKQMDELIEDEILRQ